MKLSCPREILLATVMYAALTSDLYEDSYQNKKKLICFIIEILNVIFIVEESSLAHVPRSDISFTLNNIFCNVCFCEFLLFL